MLKINRHADDFGLSKNASKVIYELCKENKLDSLSLMVNLSTANGLVDEIRELHNLGKSISIHLNFTEGKCLANPSLISSLVDEKGYFRNSWEKYFLYNFNFIIRKKIKNQLKIEILCQVRKGIEYIGSSELYLDSHQHIHMIPLVLESLIEVINENKLNIKYIRISREPIIPFITSGVSLSSFPLINFAKNFILNIFSRNAEKITAKFELTPMYVWGLIMSGEMDLERINKIMPSMIEVSEASCRDLEMIFHPGKMKTDEITGEIKRNSDISFYLSDNRDLEREGLENL